MDGKEGGESQREGAAEEQQETESCEVNKTLSGFCLRLFKFLRLTNTHRYVFRSAFYCMNEKELVEAAVSFLTNEDVVVPTNQQVAVFFTLLLSCSF